MTVADLGAETVYFPLHLSPSAGEKGTVLALDIEPSMVRYMTERADREGLRNVRPAAVPFDDPKLPAGAVHRILIVDTWHHIPDRPEYTRKLARGLRRAARHHFTQSAKGRPQHRAAERSRRRASAGGLDARPRGDALPEQ